MNITEEWRYEDAPKLIVLTGNGRREFKIAKAIGEKYDGEPVFFPIGIPLGRKTKKFTGLSVLSAVPILHRIYGVNRFLIIIDKEHIPEKIDSMIKNYGIVPTKIERKTEQVLFIECMIDGQEILVIIAIGGAKSSLEEDRSRFIFYRFGDSVPPDKNQIKQYYKRRNLNELEEIRRTKREILEKAFPGLTEAFRLLEQLINKRQYVGIPD